MLKRMKPIMFALLLTAFLVPATVFANTQTLHVSNAFSSMDITGSATDILVDVNSAQAPTDPQKEVTAKVDVSYTQADKIADYYVGRVIPITVSSSGIIKVEASAVSVSDDIDLRIYSDPACTNAVGYLDGLSTSGSYATSTTPLPSAGTFYLQVCSWYSNYDTHTFNHVVSMNISFYSNAPMDLASGMWYKLGQNSGDVYYKLTMPYKGYLTITGEEEFNFSIADENRSILKDYQRIDEDYDMKATYRLPAGTYYFVPSSYIGGDDEAYKVKYTTTKADAVMKKGLFTTVNPGDTKEVTYLKIQPTATGYIKVALESSNVFDESGDIALCNAKKVKLTADEWIYGRSATSNAQYYAVKKGTTYYLMMTGFDGKAKIKYTQTKIIEKSGATKKKAVTVKANKLVKGTILAGEKKADWYKIKLTKNKKLTFLIDGKAQGSIKFTLYNKAGKKMTTNTIVSNTSSYDLESYSKYNKGTYYIKIERTNNKSNGYYTLKWK